MAEVESSVTLEMAEKWMRHVAARPGGHDTAASIRAVVAELDRLRAVEQRAQSRSERGDEAERQVVHWILTGRVPG